MLQIRNPVQHWRRMLTGFRPCKRNLWVSVMEKLVKVFVLNRRGQPLMPCSPAKARHLLKANKATVKCRTPFTIQLSISTGETKQDVILGVDAGAKHIGLSATTEKAEVFASEVELRQDISGLLADRLAFRRGRRHRNTRYRAPRFDNRVHSKHKGWLAPSKADT